MLPFAGPGAVEQRGGDRLGGDDAGELVGEDCAHEPRARVVGAGLDRSEAGHGLHQGIVDGLVAVGASVAEARDRDVDDAGRDRADRLLAGADALGDAGPEVLHEDVGRLGERQQRGAPSLRFQVEDDGTLAAVVVQERGGHTAAPVGAGPGVVAAARALDFDDVGALVREHHRRERPGDHARQVENASPVKRSRHAQILPAASLIRLKRLRSECSAPALKFEARPCLSAPRDLARSFEDARALRRCEGSGMPTTGMPVDA